MNTSESDQEMLGEAEMLGEMVEDLEKRVRQMRGLWGLAQRLEPRVENLEENLLATAQEVQALREAVDPQVRADAVAFMAEMRR